MIKSITKSFSNIASFLTGERGFTFIETIFAVFILTVAMLGLIPLLYVGTNTSIQARMKAQANVSAQNYIERVRQMDYDEIGAPGHSPMGSLVETTTVQGAYTITITPTIVWVDDPKISGNTDYKKLTVTALVRANGTGKTTSLTTSTYIRRTQSSDNLVPPTVDFDYSGPTQMQIVSGNAVLVSMTAHTNMDNGFIADGRMYCDGFFLLDAVGGIAEFMPAAPTFSQIFHWDTLHLNQDGSQMFPDGIRTVQVETWDSYGLQAYTVRQVLIDNYPPTTPASESATITVGNSPITFSWSTATDGTEPADHYYINIWKQNMNTGAGVNVWTQVGNAINTMANPTYNYTSTPFSRYWSTAWAGSPRNLYSAGAAQLPAPIVTRPTITGTNAIQIIGGSNGKGRVTNVITTTPPTFYTTVPTVYTVYKGTSATDINTVVYTGTNSTYTNIYEDDFTKYIKGTVPTWYRVKVVFTPGGYMGGTSQTLYSNIIGPTLETKVDTPARAIPHYGW